MTTSSQLFDRPHRRYNPLNGSYVLVSPQRAKRPWQGKVEPVAVSPGLQHDPACYLCPGSTRTSGAVNPVYDSTYVFTNDFRALLDADDLPAALDQPLFKAEAANGTNRVVCYSPRHDLTLATMPVRAIEAVVRTWIAEYLELAPAYRWVQVFQNQGQMMGASNPHPHGQIWAIDALPDQAAREEAHQRAYMAAQGRPLLLDYAELEQADGRRIVVESTHWLVVVPFWAVWPYETLVLPKRAVQRMPELSDPEIADLAATLKRLLSGCDRLFDTPFPYSMGWHAAPTAADDRPHWQLHAHFYPPLLRSATIQKFMVGYEMLAEAQRDLTAEQAAEALRTVVE